VVIAETFVKREFQADPALFCPYVGSTPQPNPRESLEKLFQETPALPTAPAIELIESIPNGEKRAAVFIAYQWAQRRLSESKEVTREVFLNRAKNERSCDYLRENRSEIWGELEALL